MLGIYDFMVGGLFRLGFGKFRRFCWRSFGGFRDENILGVFGSKKESVLLGFYFVNWYFVVLMVRFWI